MPIDLSQISTEELQAELDRRKAERRYQQAKERKEKVCCRNCIHQIIGKNNFGYDSKVCEEKPVIGLSYSGRNVSYLQRYYACSTVDSEDCVDFFSKYAPEAQEIIKKRARRFRRQSKLSDNDL